MEAVQFENTAVIYMMEAVQFEMEAIILMVTTVHIVLQRINIEVTKAMCQMTAALFNKVVILSNFIAYIFKVTFSR